MFPSVHSVGLVGKAPAQPDFVRIDAGDAAALQLLSWIQEADDGFRRTGATLPESPTSFLFSSAGLDHALIGVLAPSRDQVGRAFPLAVFAAVPAASLVKQFASVPTAFSDFLSAATVLLDTAPSLNAAQLAERVRALPRPGEIEWRAGEDRRRLLLDEPVAAWVNELSESGGPLGPHYALRTFVTACKERADEPPRTPIVLSCPLGATGPSPWLELAGRLLRWRTQPPPFLWTQAAPPRLLLCLGASPGASLSYLARPEAAAPSLWPLRTTHPPSQEAARDGLSAEHRATLEDRRGSVAELISNLSR